MSGNKRARETPSCESHASAHKHPMEDAVDSPSASQQIALQLDRLLRELQVLTKEVQHLKAEKEKLSKAVGIHNSHLQRVVPFANNLRKRIKTLEDTPSGQVPGFPIRPIAFQPVRTAPSLPIKSLRPNSGPDLTEYVYTL